MTGSLKSKNRSQKYATSLRRRTGVREILVFLFLFLISHFSLPTAAFAACVGPAGNAGDLVYNANYHVYQLCNGTVWHAMGPVGDTATGIVGWWKLDDGSGTSAADSSGNGNTGTLQNTPTWTTGMNGGALTFNGTSQYVTVPSTATQLSLSGAWTVSAWVNLSALPASGNVQFFAATSDSNSDQNYAIGVENNWHCATGVTWIGYFSEYPSGTPGVACYNPSPAIATGTWYLVTATWDGSSKFSLYVNGVSVHTTTTAFVPASDGIYAFSIGNLHTNGTNSDYTSGTLDDARVYSRALSATDVMTLYTSTGGGSGNISTGLVGYWKLDETSGTVANDSSGNSNTGTLINSPTWTTNGKINGALTLVNASAQYVDIPDAASLRLSGSWTVATWVNLTTVPGSGGGRKMVAKDSGAGNPNYGINVVNNASGCAGLGWRAYFSTSGGLAVSDCYLTTINAGTWYHVVGVWDSVAKNLMLYLNGALVSTTSTSNVPDSGAGADLDLGFETGFGSGVYLNGTLDDVRIYNRALGASDVLTLYNMYATACAGPVGYTGDLLYNKASNVYQYCNGTTWLAMGKVPGTGGPGCASPAGIAGDMLFNSAAAVIQYCDGSVWRKMGAS